MSRYLVSVLAGMCCAVLVAAPAQAFPIPPALAVATSCTGTCAGTLTLSSSPNPSTAGDQVSLTGSLSGTDNPGGAVVLWRKLAGQSRFQSVARANLNGAGQFQFTFSAGKVTTSRQWYVTFGGLRSRTVRQQVHARLELATSDATPAPGEVVTLSGSVSPAHVGDHVSLAEQQGQGWRDVATARLDSDSKFSLTQTFTALGTSQFRVVLAGDSDNARSYSTPMTITTQPGIEKIKHVVIIMQENRSFDSYFGTYPGVDGIPPGVCVPDPTNGGCQAPFHDTADVNYGGPHGANNAIADIDGGNMDGFVGQSEKGSKCSSDDPSCSPCTETSAGQCIDSMGYHDSREIPNYWTYAQDFVLQDHMFEPNASWSLPEHLYLVSEWSALCTDPTDPFSCTNALQSPAQPSGALDQTPLYAWTDITYLMHKLGVSWAYYVFKGTEPDCENDSAMTCAPVKQGPKTPGIWNPLAHFTDVQQDGQLGNIQSLSNFFSAVQIGALPAVSWIIPNGTVSEHPPALVSAGQTYVTGLINAIMKSPDWDSTAIFLSWDDWGGFYDNVVPPVADQNGFGLRVPGLVISPYAKQGYIDHQTLSQDAYNKFIEDDFLGGQRLDPATDGRPDPRPDVREVNPLVGDLTSDFNFAQPPRPPVTLPACPTTDLQPPPIC